jgi:predicted NUDIX family phosphoesterase
MYPNESILVVERNILFKNLSAWNGISKIDPGLINIINTQYEFHNRPEMEENDNFKQIIPYLIFMHNDNIFLMKRKPKPGDSRLAGKYTLGIGGHIRKEDLSKSNSILEWASREFIEEINYEGNYDVKELGLINDDNTPVGRVHLGVLYLLKGNSNLISIRDEFEWGQLLSLEECKQYYPMMETWSQWAFDFIYNLHQQN